MNFETDDHYHVRELRESEWSAFSMLDPIDTGVREPRDSFIADINGDFIDDIVINFKLEDHYHIRRYVNGAWVADSMLDLDTRGIPTSRGA
ncbi:MAG: hypothetical protein QXT63_02570 [Thermoplasmata archaeon]